MVVFLAAGQAEAALADIQAELDAAIKDRSETLTTDTTAITATTAQIEAIMAALLATKDHITAVAGGPIG